MRPYNFYLQLTLTCLMVTILAVPAAFAGDPYADVDREISGYFYDPSLGDLLPQYDDLTPNQVKDYLWYKGHQSVVNAARNAKGAAILALSPEHLRFVDPANLAGLTNTQLRSLSAAQMANLTQAQFTALSATQRSQFNQAQVNGLNTAEVLIGQLTATQRSWLTADQIQQIASANQFRYLSGTQIPVLTAVQVATMTNADYARSVRLTAA